MSDDVPKEPSADDLLWPSLAGRPCDVDRAMEELDKHFPPVSPGETPQPADLVARALRDAHETLKRGMEPEDPDCG